MLILYHNKLYIVLSYAILYCKILLGGLAASGPSPHAPAARTAGDVARPSD